MAEQMRHGRDQTGPGSRTIAALLLETLTLRDRLADRARAARTAGLEGDALFASSDWLEPDAIARMFAAAAVEVSVARSLGQRLITPETLGMPLYALGLATPEKAFRRMQVLLPREALEAIWITEEIRDESAWLSYRPHRSSAESPSSISSPTAHATSCALRRGMLEAIPTLYGLLPATVHDMQCIAHGDSVCRYRVEWQRSERRGLMRATGIGVAIGSAFGLAIAMLGTGTLITAVAACTAFLVIGGAALLGRCLDLTAQLNAVGGTRRGQLALFEQVDDQLASKLDALARADAKLDESPTSFRVGLSRSHTEEEESADAWSSDAETSRRDRGVLAAAHAIHAAAGDLECWFDEECKKAASARGTRPEIGEERGRVREIRDWAMRITDEISPNVDTRRTLDVAVLVARGIASVRPLLPGKAVIHFDADEDLEAVSCEPVQIEQVVIQLVRNAIEASEAIMDTPEAWVSVRRMRSSVEIAVEDRGPGIDSTAVDEVFDPFFGDTPLGATGGIGLPTCLRIVEAHGGELRIEAEDRPGTRVSISLPLDGPPTPEPSRLA